jgi:hypothetical protein
MKNFISYEMIMRGMVLSTTMFFWFIFVATPILMLICFVLYSLVTNLFATLSSLLPILS